MSISYVYFNNSNDKLLKINKNVGKCYCNDATYLQENSSIKEQ